MFERSSLYATDSILGTTTYEPEILSIAPNDAYTGFRGTDTMDTQKTNKDILVVDDDPFLCELMTEALTSDGHSARSAANGQEALDRIRERKPQLILLDVMMPVMNGWELAAALKTNPEWADIPIVMISAAHNGVLNKQQAMDIKAVIHKPFDIDALTDMVQSYAV